MEEYLVPDSTGQLYNFSQFPMVANFPKVQNFWKVLPVADSFSRKLTGLPSVALLFSLSLIQLIAKERGVANTLGFPTFGRLETLKASPRRRGYSTIKIKQP
jgi:hypothetical protein